MNTWKRRALALLSVPLLALPSAGGVFLWLSPHIGPVLAGLTASGFELLYIGVNLLIITTPELRRYARNVALSGVATAIIFNTLARYQTMVCPPLSPEQIAAGLVSSCTLRKETFDALALALAILESIPLAGLAYAMSVLLHRLSESGVTLRMLHPARRARLARLLWKQRSAVRALRAYEQTLAPLEAMLAQARAELESARASLGTQAEQLAQARAELEAARADTEIARAAYEQSGAAAARLEEQAERQQRQLREYEQVTAQLREELAIARASASLDVLAVARRLLAADVALREIAPLVGVAESTLRGRLKSATNGHAIEDAP